ncbi:MAG: hypothetical protein K5648_07115 [Erysipelotrichaceae bacterium]|nr:hypothetical protein [Erysipelotrichaceae bacterium]
MIERGVQKEQQVSEKTAEKIIDAAVSLLNHPEFETLYEEKLKSVLKDKEDPLNDGDLIKEEDGYYKVLVDEDGISYIPASYEEVYEELILQDEEALDFERAVVVPFGETYEDTSYINENYDLLSYEDPHVFHKDGFRISYSLNSSGVDLHVSKSVKGFNIYFDASVHNVKTVFKWKDKKNDLKNCFFTLDFKTTEKLGVSTGKYKNYRVRFKDLDASSFQNLLHSLLEPLQEDEEASLPLCKIKVPLKELPGVFIVLDLKIKLYVSGKTEFVLYNSHELGFETRGGKIRYINENTHDLNSILQASGKAVLGIDFAAETMGMKLANVKLDSGARGVVRSTLHYVREDGTLEAESSAVPYSGLSELAQGNPDVLVCGDVSLHYLCDLKFNTAGTQMNKFGLSKAYSLMDEEDQIFGDLHHIENGHFVEKCTRTQKTQIIQMEKVTSDRIVLSSYAEVLHKQDTYAIGIKALPEGYEKSDLLYESEDPSIAAVENGVIHAAVPGSVRIKVFTEDGNYVSYINILVSTQ